MEDYEVRRAKEEIFDAVRCLEPDVAQKLLADLAKDMKPLADKYDRELEAVINHA